MFSKLLNFNISKFYWSVGRRSEIKKTLVRVKIIIFMTFK